MVAALVQWLTISADWKRAVMLLLAALFFSTGDVYGQSLFAPSDTLQQNRLTGLTVGTGVLYGSALLGLNELWYSQYERSDFHVANEVRHWQQMDKAGHAYAAYYESVAAYHLLRWSGVKPENSLWYGGLAGFALQTPIEILDGFSEKWGASIGDAGANAFGSALFIGQQLAWNQQVITMKFSHKPSPFPDDNPELLGKNAIQEVIKDYNSQTYWLAVSGNRLIPGDDPLPDWLQVTAGYGASGMLGSQENPSGFGDVNRYREYKLSLGIHTADFHTKSRVVNTLLDALSLIKLPLPGIQYDRQQGLQAKAIAY